MEKGSASARYDSGPVDFPLVALITRRAMPEFIRKSMSNEVGKSGRWPGQPRPKDAQVDKIDPKRRPKRCPSLPNGDQQIDAKNNAEQVEELDGPMSKTTSTKYANIFERIIKTM
jgi:hypothetical protein